MKKQKNQETKNTVQLESYAKRTVDRYQEMSRSEKRIFLDQMQQDFGCHRKSFIRLYGKLMKRRVATNHPEISNPTDEPIFRLLKKRGRPAKYDDADLVWWLQTLWIDMNQVSEQLMHPMIPEWLSKTDDERITKVIREKLLSVSPSTIERLIRSYKKENRKKIFCATQKSRAKNLLMKIPVRVHNFSASCAGYFEGDTVAHCGNSLEGIFAWTLNIVDHKTHWTEQVVFLSKTGENVVEGTIQMRARIPFPIISYHSDGGSEFINELFYTYLSNPKDFITQTHGRAYKKNDQARVEQRNWSHVRTIFGYERVQTQGLVDLMNDIYSNEWRLLNNFFTATKKQVEKTRVGAKFKRKFDKPRTPYQRVLDDEAVSQIQKEKLRTTYEQLNPFDLKKNLDRKLKMFYDGLKSQHLSTDQDTKEAA
jgi:hypothetical protein